GDPRYLHSFPTRRSSDLPGKGAPDLSIERPRTVQTGTATTGSSHHEHAPSRPSPQRQHRKTPQPATNCTRQQRQPRAPSRPPPPPQPPKTPPPRHDLHPPAAARDPVSITHGRATQWLMI